MSDAAAAPVEPAEGTTAEPAEVSDAPIEDPRTRMPDIGSDEVLAAFEYDPFEGQQDPQSEAEPTPAAQTAEGQQGSDPQPEPATPTAEPEPTPAAESADQGLRDQVSQLQGQIAQMAAQLQQSQQQQPQGQPQGAQPQPGASRPEYQYTINPQLVQGLRSENDGEFAGALSLLMQNLSQHVHERVSSETRQWVNETVPPMVNGAQQSMSTQQQIFTDFYGAYPELNTPALRPMVLEVAKGLMETGKYGSAYTPQFRTDLGKQVLLSLEQQGFVRQPAAPAQPASVPVAQGVQQGVRPASAATTPRGLDPNNPEAIQQSLFG